MKAMRWLVWFCSNHEDGARLPREMAVAQHSSLVLQYQSSTRIGADELDVDAYSQWSKLLNPASGTSSGAVIDIVGVVSGEFSSSTLEHFEVETIYAFGSRMSI